MDKKWMVLLVFFSVVTLLSSIISTSLIYNSENNRTEITSNQILASNKKYKNTLITYNQDNNINLTGLEPGYETKYKFSVTNNNSDTIKYNIEWDNISSTWNTSSEEYNVVHPEELTYNVSCTNGEKVDTKTMPINPDENEILKDLELKNNKTNECTITIKFVKKEEDQSYNLNRQFKGKYVVKIIE